MKYNNIDYLINKNLELIYNSSVPFFRTSLIDEKNKTLSQSNIILSNLMEGVGLIKVETIKGQRCDLTNFGIMVIKNGGWLNHLELEKKKHLNIKRKQNFDLKISEFQVTTRNYPFIISIIGILISLLAIYLSLSK